MNNTKILSTTKNTYVFLVVRKLENFLKTLWFLMRQIWNLLA